MVKAGDDPSLGFGTSQEQEVFCKHKQTKGKSFRDSVEHVSGRNSELEQKIHPKNISGVVLRGDT